MIKILYKYKRQRPIWMPVMSKIFRRISILATGGGLMFEEHITAWIAIICLIASEAFDEFFLQITNNTNQ